MTDLHHYQFLAARRAVILAGARMSDVARARANGVAPPYVSAKEHTITVDCAHPERRTVETVDKKPSALVKNPFVIKTPPLPPKPDPHQALREAREMSYGGPSIATVQKAFIAEAYDAGFRIWRDRKDMPYTLLDMKSKNRSRVFAWPRHVCIDLVRRICPGPIEGRMSTTAIGKAFGLRDHTTVINAISVAPDHMADPGWPWLGKVHERMLKRFGGGL